MIFDSIENSARYESVHPLMKEAFTAIRGYLANTPEDGKYPIGESGMRALVSSYASKAHENCRIEAHRKFIDIQLLLDGTEYIASCSIEDAQAPTPYDEEKDIYFFASSAEGGQVMRRGVFAVYFPEDAHRPCMTLNNGGPVKKVVIKIPV